MVDRLIRLCESARKMTYEELLGTVLSLAAEYSDTLSAFEEQAGIYREMTLQYGQMKDKLEGTKRDLAVKNKLIEKLTDQLHMSKNDLFGRSSENMEDALASAMDGDPGPQDPVAEDAQEPDADEDTWAFTSAAGLRSTAKGRKRPAEREPGPENGSLAKDRKISKGCASSKTLSMTRRRWSACLGPTGT